MSIIAWPDYPRINLAELDSLKLDPQSARRFERRFYPELLGVVVLLVVGFGGSAVLHHFHLIAGVTVAVMMVASTGLCMALGYWKDHRLLGSRPVSAQSGQTMEAFIIQDTEKPYHCELAYVDRASGTYFRKMYSEPE